MLAVFDWGSQRERTWQTMISPLLQVHLAGPEVLQNDDDLLALFSARQRQLLGRLKKKMAAAAVSGGRHAKEVRQD